MSAPPRGRLFQEELREQPFWMLAACLTVNRTSWEVAEGVLSRVRSLWPVPSCLAMANLQTLGRVLRPLGLWRARARNLRDMARVYARSPPATREDVLRLPGCGPYAADSWAIFVEGRRDVSPTDGKLNWWMTRGDRG